MFQIRLKSEEAREDLREYLQETDCRIRHWWKDSDGRILLANRLQRQDRSVLLWRAIAARSICQEGLHDLILHLN